MSQWLDRVKFGNGHDGSPAVSGTINTYASCTGTAAATSLTTALAASAGDVILIHQSRGTGAGQWEINYVLADAGATLTIAYPLAYTYGTGAQAVIMPQYTGGTLSGAVTGTSWGGSSGGIIALMSSGDLTLSGSATINGGNGSTFCSSGARSGGGTGGGFYGGNGYNPSSGGGTANQGEGTAGASAVSYAANGNGGGGGDGNDYGNGAGGGNATAGGNGTCNGNASIGGAIAGNAGLTNMVFGGGGGGGTKNYSYNIGGGGAGGGIIFIMAKTITLSGTLSMNGGNGAADGSPGGGGGAGGSCLIKCQVGTLGTNRITTAAGSGVSYQGTAGNGSVGRIHLDYADSYTGTTTPTIDATQVTTLKSQIYGGMI